MAARKTPRIWRDLVESYSRHILKLPNSNSEFYFFARKSVTKVKNQWYPSRSLIFYQDFIDSGEKRSMFWKTLSNIFLIWGQHCGWYKYFDHIFGAFICFSIVLSEPNFDFLFFYRIILVFLKKLLFETKYWKICENQSKIATENWDFFQKYQKNPIKNKNLKFGSDSTIEKHLKAPKM